MSEHQLGTILKEMYGNAPKGESVVMIHLFGVKYGQIIKDNKLSISEIVKFSGLNSSYKTEVSKGVKLSRYAVSRNY